MNIRIPFRLIFTVLFQFALLGGTVCAQQDFELELHCRLSTAERDYQAGSLFSFDVVVNNVGDEDAYNIGLVNFLPAGFILEDTEWNSHGEMALFDLLGPVKVGKSKTVKLKVRLDEDLNGGLYTNYCKIVYATNRGGKTRIALSEDWDSSPWSITKLEALDYVRVHSLELRGER